MRSMIAACWRSAEAFAAPDASAPAALTPALIMLNTPAEPAAALAAEPAIAISGRNAII
ncbi:hypothetical protein KDX23_09995 [Burkholderia vietnamiensis]|uniref:hypothetical protein n=1 Tax=Burkholderia vietnamiensis TaxID=60552 RepID=UPI001B8ECD3D|nr:hypothetical protein [Burkholderia vietnamiensis]MBR8083075.1 hypothetical protein [Burkholderia vietnamiensis]